MLSKNLYIARYTKLQDNHIYLQHILTKHVKQLNLPTLFIYMNPNPIPNDSYIAKFAISNECWTLSFKI